MNELVREISRCRSCGSGRLVNCVTLGNQYVSDFVKDEEEVLVPLNLLRCEDCWLVQLSHSVNQDRLYRHFWYQSGLASSMRDSLRDVAESAIEESRIFHIGGTVVDIGCNDGTLLKMFSNNNVTKVGFEPARNIAEKIPPKTGIIINDYFNADAFIKRVGKRADVITAIAMFYDLENPGKFVSDVASILSLSGTFIVQQNYLPVMLQMNNYDNIVHEHLEYYCLHSLQHLLKRHGLEVYKVQKNEVNGGSFRTYIGHLGKHKIDHSVQMFQMFENKLGLNTEMPYVSFMARVISETERLQDFLKRAFSNGSSVWVLGASTRGNTILQYADIGQWIHGAVDKNPDKWGLKTVGSNIPIRKRDDAGDPDYFLVLPYHFLKEFMEQERAYLENGGRFIVPLPEFRVLP